MKYNNKTLAAFFFTVHEDDANLWRCNKCYPITGKPIKNTKGTGYTNLVNHVRACVGEDFQEKMKAHLDASGVTASLDQVGRTKAAPTFNQRVIDNFCAYSDKEQRAFVWIQWLALRNQPISEIDNVLTRHLGRSWKPFSSTTIRKWIIATAAMTEKRIAEEMKEAGLVALLMDGWECDGTSTKYVGIFAGYENPRTEEYTEVLLAIQPTLAEDENQTADAHIELFDSTIDLYGVDKENVLCVVGDK